MLTDAGDMLRDAGTSMQDGSVPDAGAQQSEFFNFDCNGASFVLTDMDFEYGKTIDHTRHPADRYGVESTRPLDFARYSSFSIDGKVLAACNDAETERFLERLGQPLRVVVLCQRTSKPIVVPAGIGRACGSRSPSPHCDSAVRTSVNSAVLIYVQLHFVGNRLRFHHRQRKCALSSTHRWHPVLVIGSKGSRARGRGVHARGLGRASCSVLVPQQALDGGHRRSAADLSRTPLEQLCAAWLAAMEPEVAESTIELWETYCRAHFIPFFKNTDRLCDEASLAAYMRFRLTKVKIATFKKERSALKRLFDLFSS